MVHLDYRDARPIYTQIIDGFKEQITTGVMMPGDKLPSVRELAAQLAINPNTIQRAYRELEHEGYVQSIPGKGCFALKQTAGDTKRMESLWETLEKTAAELRFLGVSTEDLISHIKGGEQHD